MGESKKDALQITFDGKFGLSYFMAAVEIEVR